MNWHEALETQMDTHKFYTTELGVQWILSFLMSELDMKTRHPSLPYIVKDFHEGLYCGDTIAVEEDIHALIVKAAQDYDGPLYVEKENLLCHHAYVHFPAPIEFRDSNDEPMRCWGFVWSQSLIHPGVTNLYYLSNPRSDPDASSVKIREEWYKDMEEYDGIGLPPRDIMHFLPVLSPEVPATAIHNVVTGETMEPLYVPEHFSAKGSEPVLFFLKYFIALNLLAQQTVGVVTRDKPPRATRKRAERWNPKEGEHYISLITLRKKKGKKNEDPQEVPWTHRWVVGGHWRKQWYPSEQTHRYVYIYDYVKGPEHLPLVVRERRVFNFAR